MTYQFRTALVMAVIMMAASMSAVVARPTQKLADIGPKVNLEAMIPKKFGDWRIDDTIIPVLPSPDVQAGLDKIYNQTLARTYANSQGKRVMLSIAYGGDQSDAMRAHRPEVCYAGQGFSIQRSMVEQLATAFGVLPVKRLVAINGARHEPITYWIVVGDQVVNDGLGQKLAQLRYGLTGRIPDGMLVRVSTIERDDQAAFGVHQSFVREMIQSVSASVRPRIVGAIAG